MKISSFLLFLFFFCETGAQQKVLEYDSYRIDLKGNSLEIFSGETLIHKKTFHNPAEYTTDLDNDGIEEFLIIDRSGSEGSELFRMYIYNTIDSVYLADTINSGYIEPYVTVSEELEEIVIISGNTDFMQADFAGLHIPINVLKYESGELFLINDELYDIFITENEEILEYLQNYFYGRDVTCSNSREVQDAIAAAYANYINAGEPTLASQLITKYYNCNDKDAFIEQLNNLVQN
jgi:hypothetical protein